MFKESETEDMDQHKRPFSREARLLRQQAARKDLDSNVKEDSLALINNGPMSMHQTLRLSTGRCDILVRV